VRRFGSELREEVDYVRRERVLEGWLQERANQRSGAMAEPVAQDGRKLGCDSEAVDAVMQQLGAVLPALT
jgi:hypothetical protein